MRDLRFVELLAKPLSVFEMSSLADHLGPAEAVPVGEFHYLRYPQAGVSVDLGTDSTIHAFFFAHAAISSEWATGLAKEAKRDELRGALGAPTRSGNAQVIPVLGPQGAWDRWDHLEYVLHVQYAPTGDTVMKVTLMHPSGAPT